MSDNQRADLDGCTNSVDCQGDFHMRCCPSTSRGRERPGPVSHLAGPVVNFQTEQGTVVRQRCQWCGAVLVDECTWRVMVPVGQDSTIGTWEVGRFVDVDAPDGRGGMWSVNDWVEGPVPATACMRMPLEVTA